jgi:putative component of membrane protein insertase Oxa1/YidC/SpoIIIJ protein YidD
MGKTFHPAVPRTTSNAEPGADLSQPEYRLLFLAAIRVYQSTLSSQDMSVCNFTPSCSHFGQEAIRKAGLIRGLLLTSDRLQRCNGSGFRSKDYYNYDPVSGKLLDPVERYIGNR